MDATPATGRKQWLNNWDIYKFIETIIKLTERSIRNYQLQLKIIKYEESDEDYLRSLN